MTWIKIISPNEADQNLANLYSKILGLCPVGYLNGVPALEAEGCKDSIIESHGLVPKVLDSIFSACAELFSPDLPLTRRQHEMIATLVSSLNRCHYCLESHAEFLRQVCLDETMVETLRTDYRKAPLSSSDRKMLDFVAIVTKEPSKSTPEMLEGLRAEGFDDRAIFQIASIAAWFCYINRIADSLGVGRPAV
jgi:uncharacterized peroxidase-related enzyme